MTLLNGGGLLWIFITIVYCYGKERRDLQLDDLSNVFEQSSWTKDKIIDEIESKFEQAQNAAEAKRQDYFAFLNQHLFGANFTGAVYGQNVFEHNYYLGFDTSILILMMGMLWFSWSKCMSISLNISEHMSSLDDAYSNTPVEDSSIPYKSSCPFNPLEEDLMAQTAQEHPIGSSVLSKTLGRVQIQAYDESANAYTIRQTREGNVLRDINIPAEDIHRPEISELWIYPIKSCGGISVAQANLTSKGFEHDREWMFIDAKTGAFLSQRKLPQLALIQPRLPPSLSNENENENVNQGIVLQAPGMASTMIPINTNVEDERQVRVWSDKVMAIDQGDIAAHWMERFLSQHTTKRWEIRLVRMKPGFVRPTDATYASSYQTDFADGFPYLLILEASLDALRHKVLEKSGGQVANLTMRRFRPNVIVKNSIAFQDDDWACIELRGIRFHNVKYCGRCKLTTVDPEVGAFDPEGEPLRTLRSFRTGKQLGILDKAFEREILFGSNLVADVPNVSSTQSEGRPFHHRSLQVGSNVRVLTLKSSRVHHRLHFK